MIDDLVDDVNKKRNDERNAKTDLEMVESENNHAWFNWIPVVGQAVGIAKAIDTGYARYAIPLYDTTAGIINGINGTYDEKKRALERSQDNLKRKETEKKNTESKKREEMENLQKTNDELDSIAKNQEKVEYDLRKLGITQTKTENKRTECLEVQIDINSCKEKIISMIKMAAKKDESKKNEDSSTVQISRQYQILTKKCSSILDRVDSLTRWEKTFSIDN